MCALFYRELDNETGIAEPQVIGLASFQSSSVIYSW